MSAHTHRESEPSADFVSTEELVRRQGAKPFRLIEEFASSEDPFGSDEEHQAFLDDLYASRHADR